MAEEVTVTDLRLGSESLRGDIVRAKSALMGFKSEAEREKFELSVRAKFNRDEYRRMVNDTVREMQSVADRNPVQIRVTGEGGGFLTRGGNPIGEFAALGTLMRGGGALMAGTIAIRSLSEAFDKLNQQLEKGDANWKDFADDLYHSIPLLGRGMDLLDKATEAAQTFRARQMGLVISPAEKDVAKIRGDIRKQVAGEQSAAETAVESLTTRGAQERELTGLEGPDLARARARQTAEEHQAAVNKLVEQVNKQIDRTNVQDQLEKLMKEKEAIDADLAEKLADIDAKEADKLAEGAAKFAADAGAAALKAAEAHEKEEEKVREEYERARARFMQEMDRETEITARMGADAHEAALRSRGLGGAADDAAIEERIRRLYDEAGSDPDRQRSAQLLALSMMDKQAVRTRGTIADASGFGRSIQEAILNAPSDPKKEWAIGGLNEMRRQVERGENPFGPGRGMDKMDKAARDLEEASANLKNFKMVGVVKR